MIGVFAEFTEFVEIKCLAAFERLGVGQRFAKPTFRPGESYNWQTDSTAFVQKPLPAWSNSCFPREFLSQHTLPVLVSPGAKRSHRLTQLPSKWRDGILHFRRNLLVVLPHQ